MSGLFAFPTSFLCPDFQEILSWRKAGEGNPEMMNQAVRFLMHIFFSPMVPVRENYGAADLLHHGFNIDTESAGLSS